MTTRTLPLLIGAILCALPLDALADYREPKGVPTLFPRGMVKRIAMPGTTKGYMFKTVREPVLVTGKDLSSLVVITNGVDDKRWSYATILSALLRNYCGIHDGAFAKSLVAKTLDGGAATEKKMPAGSQPAERQLRESAVKDGCKVTVEVKGARWHKITTTFEAVEK